MRCCCTSWGFHFHQPRSTAAPPDWSGRPRQSNTPGLIHRMRKEGSAENPSCFCIASDSPKELSTRVDRTATADGPKSFSPTAPLVSPSDRQTDRQINDQSHRKVIISFGNRKQGARERLVAHSLSSFRFTAPVGLSSGRWRCSLRYLMLM
jgi:hypothetical protein